MSIDRTPQPVDKIEYPVREFDLAARNFFNMAGTTHWYQHSSAYLLKNLCIFSPN